MSAFYEGTSFFLQDGHLWFVISDPAISSSSAVWANISTYHVDKPDGPMNDPSCLLSRGDHGFIQHATYVCYHCSHCARISELEKRKKNRTLRLHGEPANAAMLEKMRHGALVSTHCPFECRDALIDQGLA